MQVPSELSEDPARALPAHLARFADPAAVRTGFPVVLRSLSGPAVPLPDWLGHLVAHAGTSARLVQDNLLRLERCVGEAMAATGHAEVSAGALLAAAGASMATELALRPGPDAELRAAIATMVASVPAATRLLGYSRETTLRLFREAATTAIAVHRTALRAELARAHAMLAELVAVEDSRGPAALTADAMRAKLADGVAGSFDPTALAQVASRRRGSRGLEGRTLERARAALHALAQGDLDDLPSVVVCHASSVIEVADLGKGVRTVRAADPLGAAVEEFDRYAAIAGRLHAAARTARLLARWAYQPELHDALVDGFSWRDMTSPELLALPRVIAVEDAGTLGGERLARALGLLREARPVHVLVEVQPARAIHDDRLQMDLGALAVALDRPYVLQSTPARPQHYVESAARAFAHAVPAMHVITTGYLPDGDEPSVGAWLAASAAVDSRAHPLFRYDALASSSWAGRLDVDGNPQPESAWPRYAQHDDGSTPVAFTLADFALLDPACSDAFRRATPEEADRCLPVQEWAALDAEQSFDRLPFIEVIEDGVSRRFVVSAAFATAAAERGRRWRLLAETAGVANVFALRAAEEARASERSAADLREAALRAEHALELERVRSEAAGKALGRLADALLSVDLFASSAPTARPTAAPAAAPIASAGPPPAAAAAPAASAPVAAAPASIEEAYIDTDRCTTCNDCINLNPLMFAYDGNKQAFLKDARAGTFAQLVTAAEKCPAKCIHPGPPLNPSEPGLDALVKRAAPFNA